MPDYANPVLRSPLHAWHVERRAKLSGYNRWLVPVSYAGTEQEVAAARTRLALADLSSFVRADLLGPAVPVLTWTLSGDSPAMQRHGVGSFTGPGGGLACRLAEDHLLVLASSAHAEGVLQYLLQLCQGQRAVATELTSALAEFCVIGPHSPSVLGSLTAFDVSRGLPDSSCVETGLAGAHAVLVRPGGLAVPAFRVCVGSDEAEYVWERLLDAGRAYDVVPVGLDAVKELMPLGYP
jgi:glycine cleavage system aminomethyltransferase T